MSSAGLDKIYEKCALYLEAIVNSNNNNNNEIMLEARDIKQVLTPSVIVTFLVFNLTNTR